MKNLYYEIMRMQKVIYILAFMFFANPFVWAGELKTQADIIQEARKDFVASDKRLSDIYNKINKAFSSDKEFINLLNQDKERYYKERNSQRDLVLPHSHTSYGLNSYEAYSPMYLIELNNQKIKYLKTALDMYCFFHLNMPAGCKGNTVEYIFK